MPSRLVAATGKTPSRLLCTGSAVSIFPRFIKYPWLTTSYSSLPLSMQHSQVGTSADVLPELNVSSQYFPQKAKGMKLCMTTGPFCDPLHCHICKIREAINLTTVTRSLHVLPFPAMEVPFQATAALALKNTNKAWISLK